MPNRTGEPKWILLPGLWPLSVAMDGRICFRTHLDPPHLSPFAPRVPERQLLTPIPPAAGTFSRLYWKTPNPIQANKAKYT